MIPIAQIHNPQEYMICIDSFGRMVEKGEMELVYATCPLDTVIDEQGRFVCGRNPGGRDKDKRQGL